MAAVSFGMILVHLQHILQTKSIDLFEIIPFRISFIILIIISPIFSIYIAFYRTQNFGETTLSNILSLELCRTINSTVTILITCSKSRTNDTIRNKIKGHNQLLLKVYQILAKLNSSSYIIHVTIIKLILGLYVTFNKFNTLEFILISIIVTYTISLFLFIFVEQPIINFLNSKLDVKKKEV